MEGDRVADGNSSEPVGAGAEAGSSSDGSEDGGTGSNAGATGADGSGQAGIAHHFFHRRVGDDDARRAIIGNGGDLARCLAWIDGGDGDTSFCRTKSLTKYLLGVQVGVVPLFSLFSSPLPPRSPAGVGGG